MTKLEMELPGSSNSTCPGSALQAFFLEGGVGREVNCEMGQPKISVILALHSSSSTSLQLIEYVMSIQETNLKASYTSLPPLPLLTSSAATPNRPPFCISCAVQTKVVLKTKLLRKCLHIFNQ